MSAGYDAIVVGGGHNGLVAAATLAGAGRSVCLLERNDALGGMAAGGAFSDGTPMPRIAHLLYNLSPAVRRELGLDKAPGVGLGGARALPTVSLDPGGRHVVIGTDGGVAFADGTAHPDAAVYAELTGRLRRFAGLLARLAEEAPPELPGGLTDWRGMRRALGLAGLGLSFKRMGRREMREFLRIFMSNAFDLITDQMPDGPLAGALAADAVRGAWAGPRSPGTVFSLMYRMGHGGGAALPAGGMGAVCEALAGAARDRGVTIRTGAAVEQVLFADDRACGVRLAGGEEVSTRAVLVATGQTEALRLAGPGAFDIEATRRLRNVRAKGTAAKVNLLLSGPPAFAGLSPDQAAGRILLAPSADHVERAFDPVKYGQTSAAPVVEVVVPTLTDPAPGGRHVLSAVVQYVPHTPEGGWSDAARQALLDRVLAALEPFAPGLKALVVESEVLTPADIEALTGAPGGHWHHAEMSLDQLLTVRPANGLARYRLGPEGYYLCGAAAHPGGDVMGSAGRNAARAALGDGVFG